MSLRGWRRRRFSMSAFNEAALGWGCEECANGSCGRDVTCDTLIDAPPANCTTTPIWKRAQEKGKKRGKIECKGACAEILPHAVVDITAAVVECSLFARI